MNVCPSPGNLPILPATPWSNTLGLAFCQFVKRDQGTSFTVALFAGISQPTFPRGWQPPQEKAISKLSQSLPL